MKFFYLAPLLFAFVAVSALAQDEGAPATEPPPLPPADDSGQPPAPFQTGPAELAPAEPAPADTAPMETAPTTTVVPAAPSVLGGRAPGAVEVGTLGTVEGPVAGIFDDTSGGLGYAEWNGVDRAQAEATLIGLPPAASPAVRVLLRKLLLTTAPPPVGQASAPFNAVRIRKLMDAGLLNDAAALAAQVRAPKNAETSRAQADALLFAGDDANACGDATAIRLDSDEQFWIELRAYCYALAKDPALDLSRAVLGGADPAFNALLDGVIAGRPRASVAFANPTALHVRMMQRLKLPMNMAVANLGTPGALIAVRSGATPRSVRIAAAEKALRAGALPPTTLAQVLDLVAFKPADLAAAAAMARSDSPIVGLARLRGALKRETNPEKRAELLYAAFRIGEEQQLSHIVAPVFAADAAALSPQTAWSNWAATFVRALLVAGKIDAAENWLRVGAAQDDLTVVVALTLQDPTHVNLAQPALSNLQQQSLVNEQGAGGRALLYFGLFDALALPMPPEVEVRVAPLMARDWPGRRPPAATMRRIDEAALAGRRGEVVLGVLAVIGRGPGDLAPDVTVRLVRALQTAGVSDGAHALAAEAVLAR